VHVLGIRRGKGVFVTAETAALVDPLARDALARAESGELGPEAAGLVAHLAVAGPSLLEELVEETGLAPRRPRARLERIGAVVARAVVFDDQHRHSSELARWDQVFPEPSVGGLGELIVAAVRAAVVAPEDEARGWFSWRASSALIDELVEAAQLARPAPGWLSAKETASRRAPARPGR
jgi:hypothetical protein